MDRRQSTPALMMEVGVGQACLVGAPTQPSHTPPACGDPFPTTNGPIVGRERPQLVFARRNDIFGHISTKTQ